MRVKSCRRKDRVLSEAGRYKEKSKRGTDVEKGFQKTKLGP